MKKLLRPLRLVIRIAFAVVFLIGAVLVTSVIYVFSRFEGDAVFPVDCVVVFGAAVHRAGDPGPGIIRRTETAVELYRQGSTETLILTGGKGSATQESEADVMRGVAMRDGVDPEDIITEGEASSTWENILLTRPLVDEHCESVALVSDRYHLARIELIALLQGWTEFHTYPAERSAGWHFEVRSVMREALGILYYLVVGFWY
jgi:uncharacterized SAM-binding protein YcdF (DUF218 family)